MSSSPSLSYSHSFPFFLFLSLSPSFPLSQTLQNVWMINCGATEDVRSLLDTAGPTTRIVVADARRPVHHSFNHEGDAGCVLLHCRDDETARVEDVPLPDGASDDDEGEFAGEEAEAEEGNEDDRSRHPSPSNDENDNNNENNLPSTSDASDGGNGRPSQRRRLGSEGVLSPVNANGGGGGGGNNNGARAKNPAFAAADAAKAARARARAIRAYRRAYYERGGGSTTNGSFTGLGWGKPASATLFELAHALGSDDGHALWLAAVGLADAWTSERLARPSYERLTDRLETLAACLPGAADDEVVSVRVEADVGNATGGGIGGDGDGAVIAASHATTATLRARLFGKISPFDDLAVPLLRHWSAYDALAHAPRVAIPLGTWSEAGRRRLEELLARMGLPLASARAGACTGAGARVAARLPSALAVHGGGYRIPALSFRSFRLAWDGDRLAAADVAAAAGALLEAAGGSVSSGSGGGGGGPTTTNGDDDGNGNDQPSEDPSTSAAAATARDAFWRSWNALAAGKRPRDIGSELAEGLALARHLRAAVLADGGALLARRKVRESPAGKFRWADLSAGDLSHKALFSKPAPLARLASFLRDVYAAGGGGAGIGGAGAAGSGLGTGRRVPRAARRRAVVLIGPKDANSGRCAVVAVGPYKASESEEAERANAAAQAAAVAVGGSGRQTNSSRQPRFGTLFRRAAAAVGADLGKDGFDGAAASLPAEDVERFMRELTVVAAGAQLSSSANEALAGLLG